MNPKKTTVQEIFDLLDSVQSQLQEIREKARAMSVSDRPGSNVEKDSTI